LARDPLSQHSERELAEGLRQIDAGERLVDESGLRSELLHLGLVRRDADDETLVHVTPEGRQLLRDHSPG
jgi:hypothetical protein